MQRLIDADALIEAMTKFSNATGEDMTHGIFYAHIAQTIDAVPVIRCKDCIHCADDWNGNQPMYTCELGKAGESVQPNDYCSYAEHEVTS